MTRVRHLHVLFIQKKVVPLADQLSQSQLLLLRGFCRRRITSVRLGGLARAAETGFAASVPVATGAAMFGARPVVLRRGLFPLPLRLPTAPWRSPKADAAATSDAPTAMNAAFKRRFLPNPTLRSPKPDPWQPGTSRASIEAAEGHNMLPSRHFSKHRFSRHGGSLDGSCTGSPHCGIFQQRLRQQHDAQVTASLRDLS